MDGNLQRLALDYALLFLKNEIAELEHSLDTTPSQHAIRAPLEDRLAELERDYSVFTEIANEADS